MSALIEAKRVAISRLLVAGLFVVLLIGLEGWERTWPLLEHSLALAGWTLIAFGVSGRVWASSHIAGAKNVRLVTEGPYSVTRNPLYLSSFLAGLGVTLVSETLSLPLVFGLLFFGYYRVVVEREEARLYELHGADYERYRRRVPRFWPRPSLWREAPEYTVSARKFRRSLGEVLWFVVAAGAVGFIEGMHHAGFLPTLFYLY